MCDASPVENAVLETPASGAAVVPALVEFEIEPSDWAGPCSEKEPIDTPNVDPIATHWVVVATTVGVRLTRLGALLMARLASGLWTPLEPLPVAVRALNSLNALVVPPPFVQAPPESVASCKGLTVG